MCGLSLAWVTSENSTSTSNADILRLNLLRWTLSCLLLSPESSVDCPCPWFHANSLLSSRPAVQSPTASQLPSPANSHSRPRTTSGYSEISGPRILCLVSRQNRQRNHLPWRETHIVLHYINFFSGHIPHHIWDGKTESKLYL